MPQPVAQLAAMLFAVGQVLGSSSVGAAKDKPDFVEALPWLHLTPDLQVLEPSRKATDTAVVPGLRAQIAF